MSIFPRIAIGILLLSTIAVGQQNVMGTPAFGSFGGGPDVVDLANLNVHIDTFNISKPGRGTPFSYRFSYDNSIWTPNATGWLYDPNWGWRGYAEAAVGYVSYRQSGHTCKVGTGGNTQYYDYDEYQFSYYHDPGGTQHGIGATVFDYIDLYPDDPCGIGAAHPDTAAVSTSDGSGFTGTLDASPSATLHSKSGASFSPPLNNTSPTAFTSEDNNGNEISSSDGQHFTDTIGTTALVISGTPSNGSVTYTYQTTTGTAPITVTYHNFTIQTAFGCPNLTDGTLSGVYLPVTIERQDGTFTITYEPTPGNGVNVTGRIGTLTLPTGAVIRYAYTASGVANDGINCTDGSGTYLSRTIDTNVDHPETWKCARSGNTTTITDPANNQTVIQFQGIYETQRDVYSGGNVLQTTYTCYNGTLYPDPSYPCNSTAVTLPIARVSVTTKIGSSYKQTSTTFNTTHGMPLKSYEYDFGTSAVGSLLRETDRTYQTINGPISTIYDRPTDIIVKDGSGTRYAETQLEYDVYTHNNGSFAPTSSVPNHDYNLFSNGATARGNITEISQWVSGSPGGVWVSNSFNYNDLGDLTQSADQLGKLTQFIYADSYSDGQNHNTQAFVTQITYPNTGVAHIVSSKYFYPSGLLQQATDQNAHTTSYTYDAANRPLSISYPGGGQTTYTYPNPQQVESQQLITGTSWTEAWTEVDGLGRPSRIAIANGGATGSNYDQTDICYDPQNMNSVQSTPYTGAGLSTSKICAATSGDTTYYDALGRPLQVTHPDGNSSSTIFSGITATVADEQGKSTRSQFDGLGRTTILWEDPSGLNYETEYQYDPLGNLLCTEQHGGTTSTGCSSDPSSDATSTWRVRRFGYDGLSRMVSEKTPESGTTTYAYAVNGNPCSGAGDLCSRTDARGIISTYSYDALSRLISKTFSDNTVGEYYWYDVAAPWGFTSSNYIGRLSYMNRCNGSCESWSNFGYDEMGRLVDQADCTPSTCGHSDYHTTATYDLAGNLISITYPSGRTVTNAYNAAARLQTVTFTSFNGQSVGYPYASVTAYSAAGMPLTMQYGNGTTLNLQLNSRLQLYQSILTAPSVFGVTNWASHTINYSDANGHNNGNILSISDALSSGHTQNFAYDSLNRIQSASQADSSWSQTYSPDAWGSLSKSGSLPFAPTFDRSNRITPNTVGSCANSSTIYCYDSAGNMTWDTNHSYQYDAENRVTSVDTTGATYTYDAAGQRVRKETGGSATEYVYFGGQVLAEYKPATGEWSDYMYAGGQRVARATNFEDGIEMQGTDTTGTGEWAIYGMNIIDPETGAAPVIRDGDHLIFREIESSNARGGMSLNFTDNTSTNWVATDQNGDMGNADPSGSGSWHERSINLSGFSGKTVSNTLLTMSENTTAGAWWMILSDIAIVHSDGTVIPIYVGQSAPGFTGPANSSGMTGLSIGIRHLTGDSVAETVSVSTLFYHSDHLGTSRLLTTYFGYPVWSGTFLPFGYEWNPQTTTNNYKFTGLEQDSATEGGLNHTWFRQQSPVMGRWMSPDPAGMAAADLANPQSLNRYAYVLNSPSTGTDATGLVTLPNNRALDDGPLVYYINGVCGDFTNDCLSTIGGSNFGISVTGLGQSPYPGIPGWVNVPPPSITDFLPKIPWPNPIIMDAKPTGTYMDCVKDSGNYFSAQNMLKSVSSGKYGGGFWSGAVLGNPISDAIEFGQHLSSGNWSGTWKSILSHAGGNFAESTIDNASKVSNIALTTATATSVSLTTPSGSATAISLTAHVVTLPTGIVGSAGRVLAGAVKTLNVWNYGVSAVSSMLCGLGR